MAIEMNRNLIGARPYVPGEQPSESGWIKLNQNENPYPPAPAVCEIMRSFVPDRARLYPPANYPPLRRAIGESLDWPADGVLVTNGSDEALRLIAHCYLNPGDNIGMFSPTYSYYPLIGQMFGARAVVTHLERNGECPDEINIDGVKIFFIANPNPPFGTVYEAERIGALVEACPNILFVIDEAYVPFAGRDCLSLLRRYENVFVTRTFSKSHSLAGLRVGFVLARPEPLKPLLAVCDYYNVNAMSQLAALAAWQARGYYDEQIATVVETRESSAKRLATLGFDVPPSGANLLFARHPEAPQLFCRLRERKILVRYFKTPESRDGLRITIGTPEQMDALLAALSDLLK